MLIKEKDPANNAIQALEAIKQKPNLPKDTHARVEKELKTLKAGNDGESNSAYYINFHYGNNPNWAVIHDLRLEYLGLTAQIDHVLINRWLEFYVLETKNYASGLKINERGEFSFWDDYRRRNIDIESPIEQNKRHVIVIEKILKDKGLMPTRLGIVMAPTFKPYVLVASKSSINRKEANQFNTDTVIKADVLFRQIEANIEALGIGALAKLVSSQTIQELGRRLVMYHTPMEIDYYAKFGVEPVTTTASQPIASPAPSKISDVPASKYYCFKCKTPIDEKVAFFCRINKERFGGKLYCREHQMDF
jgi:hypothetical protein